MAILFAVIFVNLVFPFGMNIIVSALTCVSIYELTKSINTPNNVLFSILGMAFGAFAPIIVYFPIFGVPIAGAILLPYTVLFFLLCFYYHEKFSALKACSIYGLSFFIVFCFVLLTKLRTNGAPHEAFYVFICINASWVADAGAYFAGVLFGRHKLCPKLSPKKTIEGVFGGFFLNTLAMFVYTCLYNLIFFGYSLHINYYVLAIIGIVGTFISIVGDLTFSYIKRSINIKDYGNVIPGHGGILDRFDSTLFVTAFLFFLFSYCPIFS